MCWPWSSSSKRFELAEGNCRGGRCQLVAARAGAVVAAISRGSAESAKWSLLGIYRGPCYAPTRCMRLVFSRSGLQSRHMATPRQCPRPIAGGP